MQTRACPHCGAPVPIGDRFCGECGKPVDSEPLAQAPQVPPVQARPVTPPAYSAPPPVSPPPAYSAPPPAYAAPGAAPAQRKGGLPIPLLIGGGLLLCVVVACIAVIASGALGDIFGSPTAEPADTPVAGITSLPVKTPASTRSLPGPTKPPATQPPATQPPSPAGNVLFQDDFSDPTAGKWDVFSDADADLSVVDGQFQISIFTTSMAVWSTNGKTAGDAVFEADVQWLGGPPEYSAGVIFRRKDSDFYVFRINTLGSYSFFLHQQDQWTPIVDWTESSAVNTGDGAANHLVVTAKGDVFVLELNGETLDTAAEPTLARGEYGMIASVYDVANGKVGFDNFVVSRLTTP